MKLEKKAIIICLTFIIIYVLGLSFLGYKNTTIKNTKLHVELTEKPRLEDDFYSYINYDVLSKVLIDESNMVDSWSYFSFYQNQIDEEKKKIIDDIVSKCDSYTSNSVYKKMCDYYYSMKNKNYDENKKIFDEFITLINSSSNISEFQDNIAIVNRKLYDANILFNLSAGVKDGNYDVSYPKIDSIFYDYSTNNNYYNLALVYDNEKSRNLIKKADVSILKEYGYSEVEARKIVSGIYEMFGQLAKYSSKGNNGDVKLYSLNELKFRFNQG